MSSFDPSNDPLLNKSLQPKPSSGIFGHAVDFVWPYIKLARLDGFFAVWLTYWPCAWGAMFAGCAYNTPWRQLLTIQLFLVFGTMLYHSAACVWNDYLDREKDRMVERTKHRPLASGVISPAAGLAWMCLLMVPYCWMISLTNPVCAWVTLVNIPWQIMYPFAKRFTYYPSVVLGLGAGWGILIGWTAVSGNLNPSIAPAIFIGSAAWCTCNDTIYGFQDKKDDAKAGIKSAALVLGSMAKPFLLLLQTIYIGSMVYAGVVLGLGPLYFCGTVLVAATHVYTNIATVNLDYSRSCLAAFASNSWIGWPMLIPFVGDYYFGVYGQRWHI